MLVIKNATISDGNKNDTLSVNIIIDGETVSDITPSSVSINSFDDIIDATGFVVVPAGIDPHVHFDTPGYTEREDFEYASRAAAAGGITCVVDMPDTSIPPVVDGTSMMTKLDVISHMSVIDFALWGGVSGNVFRSEKWRKRMDILLEQGVVGFKSYLLSGMRTFEHMFPMEMLEFAQYASDIDALVAVHAEDRNLAHVRMDTLQRRGRFDPSAYYESRGDPVEFNGINIAIEIARSVDCALHIVHVASGMGADAIVNAKRDGLDITFETCPHYLVFSNDDLESMGSIVKTAPVVKTADDVRHMWEILHSDIDYVASDHAPCSPQEKLTGNIWTDYSGMPGTELLLQFLFSEGYKKGRISLARFIELTSANAAKRLGIDGRKGKIAKGFDADLCFIDPDRKWTIYSRDMYSKNPITPLEGRKFNGKVVKTICRGALVYDENKGITVPSGYGKFIRKSS